MHIVLQLTSPWHFLNFNLISDEIFCQVFTDHCYEPTRFSCSDFDSYLILLGSRFENDPLGLIIVK